MANWKARFGMIHPRVCCDMEIYDFYRVAPPDVVLVTTHLELVDSSRRDEVESSLLLVERATRRLVQAGTDFILMNGLPILLYRGNEGHQHIVEQMGGVGTVPVTTAAEALAGAFKSLGAQRILMICSWRAESTRLLDSLKHFLSSRGIQVVAVEGLGGEFGSHEKYQITPSHLQKHVLTVASRHRDFDAVFVQSGTLATVGIVDALEQAIGKPVVSSNGANTWAYFKPFGVKAAPGHGRLLSSV